MGSLLLSVLPLALYLGGGFLAARLLPAGHAGLGAPRVAWLLNRWVIWVAMPSTVLTRLGTGGFPDLRNPSIFLPILQPWLHFALALVAVRALGRRLGWTRLTQGALFLTVGLGNTSFVGLPLLKALLGDQALGTGILLAQLGTFLILSVLGIPLAVRLSPQKQSQQSTLRIWLRPLLFPPFLALLSALLLRYRGEALPGGALVEWLGFLSRSLAPAALVSVGLSLQIRALGNARVRTPLIWALGLKLIVLPVIYWGLFTALGRTFALDPFVLKVILLEGAMASMITAGIVAAQYELDPPLAQLMVAVSIALSLLTVPLWSIVF